MRLKVNTSDGWDEGKGWGGRNEEGEVVGGVSMVLRRNKTETCKVQDRRIAKRDARWESSWHSHPGQEGLGHRSRRCKGKVSGQHSGMLKKGSTQFSWKEGS